MLSPSRPRLAGVYFPKRFIASDVFSGSCLPEGADAPVVVTEAVSGGDIPE